MTVDETNTLQGMAGEIEPLGAPADPLRPTGRVASSAPVARPMPKPRARRILVALAIAFVVVPILVWIAIVLIAASF